MLFEDSCSGWNLFFVHFIIIYPTAKAIADSTNVLLKNLGCIRFGLFDDFWG